MVAVGDQQLRAGHALAGQFRLEDLGDDPVVGSLAVTVVVDHVAVGQDRVGPGEDRPDGVEEALVLLVGGGVAADMHIGHYDEPGERLLPRLDQIAPGDRDAAPVAPEGRRGDIGVLLDPQRTAGGVDAAVAGRGRPVQRVTDGGSALGPELQLDRVLVPPARDADAGCGRGAWGGGVGLCGGRGDQRDGRRGDHERGESHGVPVLRPGKSLRASRPGCITDE